MDRRRAKSWTAAELMSLDFGTPRWAVPGVVAEGVTLLAGPPKIGKSWLVLGLAVAVASGGVALSKIDVDRGAVLYLALEDTPRRLKSRLGKVLGTASPPHNLTISCSCEPIPDGGGERIDTWLRDHPDARLVVIDVLTRVRGRPAGSSQSAYDADYAAVAAVKQIADRHGVAIVVVHHVRKAGADDFLSEVSGTHGIAGAADAVMVLRRSRGDAEGELNVVGRDVDEQTFALSFDGDDGAWALVDGPATDHLIGETRAAILAFVREHGPVRQSRIKAGTSFSMANVKKTCRRMVDDGQLVHSRSDGYSIPGVSTVSSVSSAAQGPHGMSPTASPRTSRTGRSSSHGTRAGALSEGVDLDVSHLADGGDLAARGPWC